MSSDKTIDTASLDDAVATKATPPKKVTAKPVADSKVEDALRASVEPADSSKETLNTSKEEVAEDVLRVELPPVFSVEESDSKPDGVKFVLQAYDPGCCSCGHLVPTEEQKFDRCHYSQGNVFCPAKYVEIQFVGRRQRMLSSIRKAKESGNPNKVLNLMNKLQDENQADRTWVMTELGLI